MEIEELVMDAEIMEVGKNIKYLDIKNYSTPVSPCTPYSPPSPPDYDGPSWDGD